jgi:hypothetical protein
MTFAEIIDFHNPDLALVVFIVLAFFLLLAILTDSAAYKRWRGK